MTADRTPARKQRPPGVPRRTRSAPVPDCHAGTVTESIEAFLARGGCVEQLDAGARGQPILRDMRLIHAETWAATIARKKKDKKITATRI